MVQQKQKSNTNKTKVILLVSAIVIGLAAVIMITKAYVTHSSPTTGLTFLAIGLVFLAIGITRRSGNGKPESN